MLHPCGYPDVEVASVEDGALLEAPAGELVVIAAGSMMTVLVEVAVRPDGSVAT